jgi:hypothetical protein
LVVGGGAGQPPATVTTGANVLTALAINVGSAGAFITSPDFSAQVAIPEEAWTNISNDSANATGPFGARWIMASWVSTDSPPKLRIYYGADGKTWTPLAGNPVYTAPGGQDVGPPDIVKYDGKFFCAFNGGTYGSGGKLLIISSPDLVTWTLVVTLTYTGLFSGQDYVWPPKWLLDYNGDVRLYFTAVNYTSGEGQIWTTKASNRDLSTWGTPAQVTGLTGGTPGGWLRDFEPFKTAGKYRAVYVAANNDGGFVAYQASSSNAITGWATGTDGVAGYEALSVVPLQDGRWRVYAETGDASADGLVYGESTAGLTGLLASLASPTQLLPTLARHHGSVIHLGLSDTEQSGYASNYDPQAVAITGGTATLSTLTTTGTTTVGALTSTGAGLFPSLDLATSSAQPTVGRPFAYAESGANNALVLNAGSATGYVWLSFAKGSGAVVADSATATNTFLSTNGSTGTLRVTTNGSTLGTVDAATFTGNAATVTTIPALSGAITNTGNATVLGSFTMAQLSTAVSDGDPAYVGAANTFTTGQTISATTSLLLGTAGSAVGTIGFRNATSGTTTVAPAAGALGTQTVTLPLTGTLATLAGTETLTNKRITQRSGTATSSATPTINTDSVDFYSLTAQAADITSFTTNLSGTPTEGQTLWIAITGTAARAITWGATFEAGAVALPTTTVTTTRLDVAFVWNTVTSKWRCMASG